MPFRDSSVAAVGVFEPLAVGVLVLSAVSKDGNKCEAFGVLASSFVGEGSLEGVSRPEVDITGDGLCLGGLTYS